MTETEERRLKALKIVEEMTDNLETPHGFLPSGSCVLDAVLGGGYPYGKFTMIYGKFAGGKTSLGTIASLLSLKRGGLGIVLDVERKFNMHYAKKLGEKYGVNAESLIIIKPESLENCLSIIDELILSNYKGQTETVIFWDSLTASCGEDVDYKTGTKKNARGVSTMDMMRAKMGVNSQLLARWFRRKPFKKMADSKICLLASSQIQDSFALYGDPYNIPGGHAPKHAAMIMLEISSHKKDNDSKYIDDLKKEKAGVFIKCKTTRNNIIAPFRECWLPLYYSRGIDDALAMLLFLKEHSLIDRAGSFFKYNGKNYRQNDLIDMINTDKAFYAEIAELIATTI